MLLFCFLPLLYLGEPPRVSAAAATHWDPTLETEDELGSRPAGTPPGHPERQ